MTNSYYKCILCFVHITMVYGNSQFSEEFRSCADSTDCLPFQEAFCYNATCVCNFGFVRVPGNVSCLPVSIELGSDCEDSAQCTQMLGSLVHCVDKECQCLEGAVDIQGRCYKTNNFGSNCTPGGDCPSQRGNNPGAPEMDQINREHVKRKPTDLHEDDEEILQKKGCGNAKLVTSTFVLSVWTLHLVL